MKEIKRHCAYIDGTTGYQCVLSMCRFKGFPSKAQIARGDLQTPKGMLSGRTFYFCIPALDFDISNRNGEEPSYDEMVEEQVSCSHYSTERTIKIPKKYCTR